jgi:hypothetical protein
MLLGVVLLFPVHSMAVTDSFTGTDGTALPTYSANWSIVAPSTYNNAEIKTNAVSSVGSSGNRYSGRTWANDQYSQAVVVALPDIRWAVVVRGTTADAVTYYAGGINPGSLGHNRYVIWKAVNGVVTELAIHGSQSMLATDVVKLEVVGTSLTLTVNSIVVLGPTTDTAITSGQAGLTLHHTVPATAVFDTWQGDDVVSGGATFGFIRRRQE